MVTLLVLESTACLREQLRMAYYLAGANDKCREASKFPIIFNGANYLIKMHDDTTFLAGTEYSKIFNISKKSDPFLIYAATSYAVVKGASK